MNSSLQTVFIASLLAVAVAPASAGQTYSVTPLQDLVPGYTGYAGLLNVPAAIGPTGTIVGNAYETTVDASTAVQWNAAGEIGALYTGAGATDINGKGQILIDSGSILLYENGVLSPVNIDFGSGGAPWVNQLNDAGQIAGSFYSPVGPAGQRHAFLATNGVAVTIGAVPGATFSNANGLNKLGDVVFDAYTPNVGYRGVLWRNGSIIELGFLSGQTTSFANAINDQGRIAGSSGGRLFTWENGVMTDLGNYASGAMLTAKAINNNGDIVGHITRPGNATTATFSTPFLLSNGVFTDIGPVIKDGTNCTVADINDAGQIAMQCGEMAYRLSPTTPGIDLGVTVRTATGSGLVGTPFTYTIEVTNVGSLTATNVIVSDLLPTNQTFISAVPSQGSCSGTSSITCALGSLASSEKATVNLTVVVNTLPGGFLPGVSNSASVSSNEADVNAPNNTGSAIVYITAPVADLSVKASVTPSSAKLNTNFTYTFTAKNNGPSAAPGVNLTDTLPTGMTFVSAKASQGTCSGTSTVTCSVGTLSNGASATVTIIVKATKTGTFTNKATVSGSVQDNSATNNTASISTTVK